MQPKTFVAQKSESAIDHSKQMIQEISLKLQEPQW